MASGSSYALLVAYDRLLEGLDRILQYHFEFLNLGYGAYLVFYELCRQAFPEITDQTIAQMVSGIDVLVLRPDDELRRLARLAVELGVGEPVEGGRSEDELRASLAGSEPGARWLADFEETKDPWFYFSYGNGVFYHHHRSWIDDATLPIATIGSYIERLEAGEDISRPAEAVRAERERITLEYRALLAGRELGRRSTSSLALARTVFPYVENHNFYIDHWYLTIFWNKVREFGALLAAARLPRPTTRTSSTCATTRCARRSRSSGSGWSSGGAGLRAGPRHWPPIVERRKAIYDAMRRWAPPPALGRVPETITEPITVMLFGHHDRALSGMALGSDGAGGAR